MGTVWKIVIIIIIISIESWLHIISLPYLQTGTLSNAIWRHFSLDWPVQTRVAIRVEWSLHSFSSPQTCLHGCTPHEVTCLQGNRNRETGSIKNACTITKSYGKLYVYLCSRVKPGGGFAGRERVFQQLLNFPSFGNQLLMNLNILSCNVHHSHIVLVYSYRCC